MAYAIVRLVLAAAWVPLMARFLRGWHKRSNPVSLAICATIVALIHNNVVAALVEMGQITGDTVQVLVVCVNVVVVANFYLSFHWSKRLFPDDRGIPYKEPTKTEGA